MTVTSAIKITNSYPSISFRPSIIITLLLSNRATLVFIDFIIAISSFGMFTWLSPWVSIFEFNQGSIVSMLVFGVAFVCSALGMGYYERVRRNSIYKILMIGSIATLISMSIGLTSVYFLFYDKFGRLTFAYGAVGAFTSITVYRIIIAKLSKKFPCRFKLVGNSNLINEISGFFSIKKVPIQEYKLVGHLDIDTSMVDFSELKSEEITDLIIARSSLSEHEFIEFSMGALRHGLKIWDDIEFYSYLFERIPSDRFSFNFLTTHKVSARDYLSQLLKRAFDIIIALLSLVILLPLFIVISLIIKITSKGPILFIQPRQGRFNEPFFMYKFRTMKFDESCVFASAGFTKKADSRVTWIGRILRPLHLDELPQLINILLGQMSLVGPRPEALKFAEKMSQQISTYDIRYLARPGLTGHAQIMCGYMMDNAEDTRIKLSYDLFYVQNQSFLFDISIIIRTVFIVLKKSIK